MTEHYHAFYWTVFTGIISALACGLGAIPVHFIDQNGKAGDRIRSLASAIAAGMMIAASVFSLAQEGMDFETRYWYAPYAVILGLCLGGLFFKLTEQFVDDHHFEKKIGFVGKTKKSFLIFLTMFIHSIPEGVAIGVGFATGHFGFGLLIATAIAVHNIPEGIAVSLPLKADGESTWKCAWLSILTSVPQPVMAIPAFLLASMFEPILPFGLGFAGGAMIYIVFSELIPDSLALGGKRLTAFGVMAGLTGMLLFITILKKAEVFLSAVQ